MLAREDEFLTALKVVIDENEADCAIEPGVDCGVDEDFLEENGAKQVVQKIATN